MEVFASATPFTTHIFPLRHMASFGDISELELSDLARILGALLAKIYGRLENPDLSFHDSQRSGGICPALEASGYCQTALRGENSNAFVPSCFQETRCTQTH